MKKERRLSKYHDFFKEFKRKGTKKVYLKSKKNLKINEWYYLWLTQKVKLYWNYPKIWYNKIHFTIQPQILTFEMKY